jgi:ribose 5-phosphate isomerase B
LPPEDEIRALVGRVLDGVLGEAGEPPSGDPGGAADDAEAGVPAERTVAVGADHGGYRLKERIAFRLREQGWEVADCGTDSTDSTDYPTFAHRVAERVASGDSQWGIVIDGAGIGSAMVANKVPGVRAALCYDVSSARNSREHNHANVLTLGAGLIGEALALQIVETWLATPWGGGRHARRVAMIGEIEGRHLAGAPTGEPG